MPNLFAMGADGKIAGRCRALEAVRIFYELDNQFMNMLSGRERIQMGILFSDSLKELPREPKLEQRPAGRLRPSSSSRTALSSQEWDECFRWADGEVVGRGVFAIEHLGSEARAADRFCSSFSLRKPRKTGETKAKSDVYQDRHDLCSFPYCEQPPRIQ